ncbi:MAG: AAA family ATPase [Verrucomicrobiota bacterium]
MPVPDAQIDQARNTPIVQVWNMLGLPEIKRPGAPVSSPFREDRNPSMQVAGDKNICYDHATGETWDTIALVEGVKECGFAEAVAFINGVNMPYNQNQRSTAKTQPKQKAWKTLDDARQIFEPLPLASEHDQTAFFLWMDYGLEACMIPVDWKVYEYRGELGIVTPGLGPGGIVVAYKWKPLSRKKGKRIPAYLCGEGGAILFVKQDAPMVIVGGEEKALAAYAAGYSVLSPLTGEKALDAQWIDWLLERPTEVILANDHDQAGHDANEKTWKALESAGFDMSLVRSVTWPNGTPSKGDLNDLLKQGGVQYVQEALRDHRALSIMNLSDLMAVEVQSNDNLMGDRMLSRGEAMAVFGPPGIGKSRLVLQMAIDFTMNRPWCGMITHEPALKFLYLQTENSPRRMQYDLRQMTQGLGGYYRDLIDRHLYILLPINEQDRFLTFEKQENVQRLMREVRRYRPDVVIYDPLIEFFQGESENDNNQMKDCYQLMMRIARAGNHDAAVVIVHHAKTGKQAIRGAAGWDAASFGRGAKALYGAVRSAVNIVPASETDEGMLAMIPSKNNNGKRPDKCAMALHQDSMTYQQIDGFSWGDWEDSLSDRGKRGPKPKVTMLDIYEICPKLDGMKKSDLVALMVVEKEISKTQVYNLVKAAIVKGEIIQEKQSLYYPGEMVPYEMKNPDEMTL